MDREREQAEDTAALRIREGRTVTQHDVMVRLTGECPWCSGHVKGSCPEPDGDVIWNG